jgi:hypothetical protein
MLAGSSPCLRKAPGLPFPDARATETNGKISRSNFERKRQLSVCRDNLIWAVEVQIVSKISLFRTAGPCQLRRLPLVWLSPAWSEAAHLALGLGAPQPGKRVARDHAPAEHGADLPARLVH